MPGAPCKNHKGEDLYRFVHTSRMEAFLDRRSNDAERAYLLPFRGTIS